MSKQLLVDPAGVNGYFEPLPMPIMESKVSDRGLPLVRGILQRKEALNQNRRRYPSAILEREVKRYMENEVKGRSAVGELDHPDRPTVELKTASHNIIEMHWEGNDLIGTVEILPTPNGNIVKALLDSGIRVGISSRGMGSVKEISESDGQPAVEVQDDFEISCWDFVSNPSTHGAWMNPVNEGLIAEGKKPIIIEDKYKKVNELIGDIICEMTGVCCLPCAAKETNCEES